jgi:hypothetical protein
MDVGGWLRGLGLEQYEANFRDNKVDAAVLPQLTADDLKDIGVAAVGDRRKLLADRGVSWAAPPASSTAEILDPKKRASFRRTPASGGHVLRSRGLDHSAALDTEDWRNLVSAYLDAASEAVAQMGGRVAKKLGDGLMALFGTRSRRRTIPSAPFAPARDPARPRGTQPRELWLGPPAARAGGGNELPLFLEFRPNLPDRQ